MIYHLLYPLHTKIFAFNLFRYITVRATFSGITALVLSFLIGPRIIRWLKRRKILATIREEGIPSQEKNHGVIPTMGGVLILLVVILSTLLWANLKKSCVWLILFLFISLGVVGFWDDMRKVRKKNGICGWYKILFQCMVGVIVGLYLFCKSPIPSFKTYTSFLFFKNIFISLGCFYIPFVVLVIVGTSNATNIADGLDGLAIGLIGEVALGFAILSYVAGNIKIAEYLNILYIPNSGELTIFLSAVVGSALGFLWYNMHPAQIIMGDTGALALGGAIGGVACFIKQEILLLITGGVFVLEALSVILQVLYFKTTKGKRIFLMAPIHHHFEKLGIPQEKIVVRFWIVGILCLLLAWSTLKIR